MIINIILIVLIIFLGVLICGRCWKLLSDFHHNNYSYFDFVFLTLYFTEQFLFLSLYNLDVSHRELWVGMIVLFTTTTASLDKFMMNSRQRRNSEIIGWALDDIEEMERIINSKELQIEDLTYEIKSMRDFIINKSKK